MISRDYRWIRAHFEELVTKYGGKYVAVAFGKVVASGKSGKKVYDTAIKKSHSKKPFVFPVPKPEDFNCLL